MTPNQIHAAVRINARLYGLTPVDPSEVRTNVYLGCTCGCND